MPRDTDVWIRRIKVVEREAIAARLAVDRLIQQAETDPVILGDQLRLRDVRRTADRLDRTYIIRLFAEFETALREFWEATRHTEPPIRTRDLVESVAVRQKVPKDHHEQVHAVREYRNALIHEREDEVEVIDVAPARSHLCRFLSYLPEEWA